jgi:hypothetical protein
MDMLKTYGKWTPSDADLRLIFHELEMENAPRNESELHLFLRERFSLASIAQSSTIATDLSLAREHIQALKGNLARAHEIIQYLLNIAIGDD